MKSNEEIIEYLEEQITFKTKALEEDPNTHVINMYHQGSVAAYKNVLYYLTKTDEE